MADNKMRFSENFDSATANINIDDLREKKLRDKKLGIALNEIILCLLFVGMTMSVSYQMLDTDSFGYQTNLLNLFGAGSVSNSFNSVRI